MFLENRPILKPNKLSYEITLLKNSGPTLDEDVHNSHDAYPDNKLNKSTDNDLKDTFLKSLEEPEQHICDVCGKVYGTLHILKNHRKRHDPDCWDKCHICGKTFPDGLKRHIRTHSQDMVFKCKQCPTSFLRINALRDHMDQHNQATYKCKTCDKLFYTRTSLWRHNHNHKASYILKKVSFNKQQMSKSLEKRFSCQYCAYSCVTKVQLTDHERIHTGERPYSCSVCDKTFTTKSGKAEHQKLHSTEPNFQCSQCKRKFHRNRYLTRHFVAMHSNEFRYKCEMCGKAFRTSSTKSLHKRTYHSESIQKDKGNLTTKTADDGSNEIKIEIIHT